MRARILSAGRVVRGGRGGTDGLGDCSDVSGEDSEGIGCRCRAARGLVVTERHRKRNERVEPRRMAADMTNWRKCNERSLRPS